MEPTYQESLDQNVFRAFSTFRFPSPPPPTQASQESVFFDTYRPDFYEESSPCTLLPPPMTMEQQPILPGPTLCLQCKGQRYGFTNYFHNPKIFPEAPHHLLHLVEQSYFLRDRLKSLLVSYAMRDLEVEYLQSIESEVQAWAHGVAVFSNHVLCSATLFELRMRPLVELKRWTEEMRKQLLEHVRGQKRLEMPKGRLQVLLGEFRRAWELVWVGYLEDQRHLDAQYQPELGQPGEEVFDAAQWMKDGS